MVLPLLAMAAPFVFDAVSGLFTQDEEEEYYEDEYYYGQYEDYEEEDWWPFW